jgi:hypothetical protein
MVEKHGNSYISALIEGYMLEWVRRGWYEPKSIRNGRLTYAMTPLGKRHLRSLIEDEFTNVVEK